MFQGIKPAAALNVGYSLLILVLLPAAFRKTEDSADLDVLLKKVSAYCQKLEGAAFDFVCTEEIEETIDPTLDFGLTRTRAFDLSWARSGKVIIAGSPPKIKHSYVYDYQCICSGRAIREVRTLLNEDRKKTNVPNSTLKTSVVVFGSVLMGPVGLFGERFQPEFEYALIGRDKIEKRPVVIIDAKPKPGGSETRNLYGKAWVNPATADILKIEWSDSRVGRYEIFEKRGEISGLTPRLNIRSEFSVEKNGIRFPSRLFVEEAYLRKHGPAFVRSKTAVRYKDFKFFTVEVEVRS